MSCKKIFCKYYETVQNGKCAYEGNECINCSMYQSIHAKVNCVHYIAHGKCRGICDILQGKYTKYAPCADPRIKRDGKPVECTFFEKNT